MSPVQSVKYLSGMDQILEENLTLERHRLSKAEARIFLLSGILTCGECGRPLNGQSAHGKYGVHRYYFHAYKRGEKIECSQKRIRADELEQVVVDHLVEAAGRAGYFEQLQKKLDSALKENPKQIEEQIKKVRGQLVEIEKEIALTFKIQVSAAGGSEAAALAAEHLESLGSRKKVLRKYVEDLEVLDANQRNSGEMCETIETRIREFKRGFGKSSPATKRRMLRRVFEKLVLNPKGLDAYFRISEGCEQRGTEPFEAAEGGKVLKFEKKKQPKPVLSGSESDLNLLSETLLNCGIGWGCRTRTCE